MASELFDYCNRIYDELNAIYEGKATQEQIDRLTDKLGPTIGKVYGWEFPTDKAARVSSRDAR